MLIIFPYKKTSTNSNEKIIKLDKKIIKLDKKIVEFDKEIVKLDKKIVELDKKIVELDIKRRLLVLTKGKSSSSIKKIIDFNPEAIFNQNEIPDPGIIITEKTFEY